MSKLKPVNFDGFTLKKVSITDKGLTAEYEEKRVIENKPVVVDHSVKADYLPHPDLIATRDTLRDYLIKSYNLHLGFETALKYATKGEQKKKVEEQMESLYSTVEVTGISIGGSDQLRGCVISGKILSFNKSKQAMNSPRITFSSEKIGFEAEVEGCCELIEREVYKYLFDGKKAQQDLFDEKNADDGVRELKPTGSDSGGLS